MSTCKYKLGKDIRDWINKLNQSIERANIGQGPLQRELEALVCDISVAIINNQSRYSVRS
jgi:hypothetical protein